MAICYDLRFPELFRELASRVALYVVPAAWPAARTDHWSTLLRARAIEDQAFVVGCNMAGTDHGVALAGCSTVVDPWGVVVAEAGSEPGRLDATLDLDAVAAVRSELPALADRRWPLAGDGRPR
jgi:predicted amidohydrolase